MDNMDNIRTIYDTILFTLYNREDRIHRVLDSETFVLVVEELTGRDVSNISLSSHLNIKCVKEEYQVLFKMYHDNLNVFLDYVLRVIERK